MPERSAPRSSLATAWQPNVAQSSASFNARAGTLRGLHYQAAPHGEAKLVRCTRGAIFDVAVELRPGSPTGRRATPAAQAVGASAARPARTGA
ncbi:MAG: dTDP-4-dehydrorhamnose 3,5-epimerase family protein, partial [Solirubrobacteraceae bacterium]